MSEVNILRSNTLCRPSLKIDANHQLPKNIRAFALLNGILKNYTEIYRQELLKESVMKFSEMDGFFVTEADAKGYYIILNRASATEVLLQLCNKRDKVDESRCVRPADDAYRVIYFLPERSMGYFPAGSNHDHDQDTEHYKNSTPAELVEIVNGTLTAAGLTRNILSESSLFTEESLCLLEDLFGKNNAQTMLNKLKMNRSD